MNLHSPYPYWLLRHGIINSYPSLNVDLKTEVVVMGAGISGALVANQLCQAGYKVVIVDRRHAGMGSTAASTSLLQYEIDKPLHQLINLAGEKNAVRSYQLCRQAIFDIKQICEQLKDTGLFSQKPSFQFASIKKDAADLKKEYILRKQAGFSLQWLDEESIYKKFGFAKPAGLLSQDGAEADAYKITHSLLKKWISRGLQVYDNTEIITIRHRKHEVELITADNKKIRAKKLIIACGYESQQYIPKKVQELQATYAIASEPFAEKNFWYKNALIWETATPYLYLRTTSDNRILVGGKDIPFSNPIKRDSLLPQKTKSLEKSFAKLFPQIQFKTDFKWAGTFASTKDGLPYIGSIRQRPHTYFALGFGGNGITFSAIAANLIRDILAGKKNKDADIFNFDR
jgi:glycine/D-amino acid oxidase-like deaminating enzyme